ncbi:MAG TPA: hypothetical protein VF420_07345 [Casimicrobiaceae bacterium]
MTRHMIRTSLSVSRTRRSGWRTWLVCYALVALAWPSLGPLPWLAEMAAHRAFAVEAEQAGAASILAHDHRDDDASSIPGSPTHPFDHDCLQCQVLKHLSRCVPLAPELPQVFLPTGCAVQPIVRAQSQRSGHVASLPPARGPPRGDA